jgi:aspartyl-tRNA(Asn)/glutamyl-tRNA(Gln) amidotransferase subunit A
VNALETAAAVRSRALSARETTEAALERIAASDARLNAFTALFAERARARAEEIDAALAAGRDPGPLAGVPFAAKNLFDVAGVVTRAGAKVTASDPPATSDAAVVAAFERAGAVLVGATNMDEFAYGFVTENAHDGATHNPHDLSRIAGGSSGGSAAAVAAGLVPLALASDTNGSIRVPAALCGIFGLRPTLGAISTRGSYPFVHSLDTAGPFARTAADLRIAFEALAPAPAAGPVAAPGGPLRCARLGGYFEAELLPEARAGVDAICAALNVRAVVELAHARQAREAAFLITAAEAGQLHLARLRTCSADYDPATRDRLIAGALMPAAWYLGAQRFRSFFAAEIRAAFDACDVLIAPATPYAAPAIGQRTIVIDGVETDVRPNVGVFTQPITLAGVPVVTVPVFGAGALPVGVQLIGRAGSERALLALAEEVERCGAAGAGPVPVAA